MNLKKIANRKNLKKVATNTIEQQLKVLMGALATIFIHKIIQYLVRRFPKLSFLKMAEDRNLRG